MAWFDDLELPGSTITGYFGFVHEDGPDEDDNPDVRLASGTVRFEPTAPAVKAGGAWIGIAPVEAELFEGELVTSEEDLRPPRILSTDADTGVENWGWRATFDIRGASIKPVTFRAPTEGVHLTGGELLPITGNPIEVVAGPPGDSAYDVAVQNGFEGTETEWLESLKGDGLADRIAALEAATRDTGVRDVSGDLLNGDVVSLGSGGHAWIQRVGGRVHLSLYAVEFEAEGTVLVVSTLPTGFRPIDREGYSLSIDPKLNREAILLASGLRVYQVPSNGGRIRASISWATKDAWPSTLPGDPA